MPRATVFTEPLVTTQFSPLQLRPRALLDMVIGGFARWLAEHLGTPFSRLVADHHCGVVVRTVRLSWHRPDLRFHQADWLTSRVRLSTSDTGERLLLRLDLESSDHGHPGHGAPSRSVAQAELVLRVLQLAGDDSLAAVPGALPPGLLGLFADDERHPSARFQRPPPPGESPYAVGAAIIAPAQWSTVLHRSHCEVADQWSFIEMIELATGARERIFSVGSATAEIPPDAARAAVGAPVRHILASFERPMFAFDEARITTRAHRLQEGGRNVFHHEITAPGRRRPSLRVWELLDSW